MKPVKVYEYLVQTRQRMLDAARSLSAQQYAREFPFGLKTIGSTLTHMMISEWYYIERLQGCDVPPYEQWPFQYERPPAFEVIERTWREQQQRIASVIAAERDWDRSISWLSFPDDTQSNRRFHITCTAGDLLAQLAFHEIHHRSQIMVMLRLLGDRHAIVEDIDYNALMYRRVAAAE